MTSPSFNSIELALRFAEVALGVADARTRARVLHEIMMDDEAADAMADWEQAFAPLAEDMNEVAPPARVWEQVKKICNGK